MQTQYVTPSPPPLPPPVVLLNRLLLTEHCSLTSLIPPSINLAPELLTARATKVTAILEGILATTGYRHGGINE